MIDWTSGDWIIFFGGVASLIGVLTTNIIAIRSSWRNAGAIREVNAAVEHNTAKTEEIRVATDGLTTQLTAATRTAGIAEGRDQMEAENIETAAILERGRVAGRAENVPKP